MISIIDMDQFLTKSEKNFIHRIRKRVAKTIYEHKLITDNDCILVGVSGGKDSLVLLDILANLRRILPFSYNVKAIHINVTNVPFEVDVDFIRKLAEEYGIEFIFKEIEIDFKRNPELSTCFRCSWGRRTTLFRLTEELGCTKLAFGHHLDDANETLLLNMIFNSEISSLPYKVNMFNEKFWLIRPLLDVEGDKVAKYSEILKLKAEVKRCPHEKINRRAMVRDVLEKFYKIHEGIRKSFFKSARKIVFKYLPLDNQTEEFILQNEIFDLNDLMKKIDLKVKEQN